MKRILPCLAVIALAVPLSASSAQTAPANSGAKLGQCIVLSTTGRDRLLVARWMGASLASVPQLEGVVTVNAAGKAKIDSDMAALFVRLFTVDCVDEARPLIQAGDRDGVRAAGSALGKIAVDELLSDPSANKALMSFTGQIDEKAFAPLQK